MEHRNCIRIESELHHHKAHKVSIGGNSPVGVARKLKLEEISILQDFFEACRFSDLCFCVFGYENIRPRLGSKTGYYI